MILDNEHALVMEYRFNIYIELKMFVFEV